MMTVNLSPERDRDYSAWLASLNGDVHLYRCKTCGVMQWIHRHGALRPRCDCGAAYELVLAGMQGT